MTYKELFRRYKEGLASDEEKRIIENEIEKYEALEAFLSEGIEDALDEKWEVGSFEHERETLNLKKSVNKKLRKMTLASVLSLLVLYVGIFHIISPLVDWAYYRPDKKSVGQNENDISFDLYALSEVNMPGVSVSNVLVDKEGFGKYRLRYAYKDVFTGEDSNVDQSIQRGKIGLTYGGKTYNPQMFLGVRHADTLDEGDFENKKQAVIKHLKDLNSVSYVSLGLVFHEDLSLEDLYKLETDFPELDFQWAGIRTSASHDEAHSLIGMHLLNSSSRSPMLGDAGILKKYPNFFILDGLVNPLASEVGQGVAISKVYERHYLNILEYLADREEAVNLLEPMRHKSEFYKLALDYAKDQGIRTYGVLVFGEAKDLLELAHHENVKDLDFNQAMVSKRNRK